MHTAEVNEWRQLSLLPVTEMNEEKQFFNSKHHDSAWDVYKKKIYMDNI